MAFRDRPRDWERTSRRVIERDGGICWICLLPGADTADHVVPRSKGGSHDDENLRAAHRICNSRRGNRSGVPLTLPPARPSRWQ